MSKSIRLSKQIHCGIFFVGVVFVFLLVFLPIGKMSKVAADTIADDSDVYTSTESVLTASYEELVDSLDKDQFQNYLSTLEMNHSYVIPGISQTNIKNELACDSMVPQGVCVAEDYLIISAYDKGDKVLRNTSYICDDKQKSVLYIMDVETKEYLTTISLNTRCHVGALAYNKDDDLIYIADSENSVVQMVSLEKIKTCVDSGNDTEYDMLEFDEGAIDTKGYRPSFLAYYNEHLYVGQFAKIHAFELFSNRMAIYKSDGTLVQEGAIKIPYYAQGVTFAEYEDEAYMLISSSFGRKKSAKLHVYLMEKEQGGYLSSQFKIGDIACPNMSEDIEIQGDYIYTCYESASNFYRLSLDGKGRSNNAVDRIMVSSLGKTLAYLTNNFNGKNVRMPVQYRPHKRHRVDDDSRRRLNLRLSLFFSVPTVSTKIFNWNSNRF